MTSSQFIHPIVTHSISPHHKSTNQNKKIINSNYSHHNSSVSVYKYNNNTKNLKIYSEKTSNKFARSSNTSLTANPTNKNSANQSNSTLTPSNNKSNNTNNYIINTLNVSAKNVVGSSVDYLKPIDYEVKMKQLQKENEDLKLKYKIQGEIIKGYEAKNKQLERRLNETQAMNKRIKKKFNEVQEKENQLLAILYVIDQSGVCVDDIIDKYNKENEPKMDTKRTIDSNMYTPITLEHSAQPKPLENIPKLNFKNIHNNYTKNRNNKVYQINDNSLFLFEDNDESF